MTIKSQLRTIFALALGVAAGGFYWYYVNYMGDAKVQYKTANVQKMDLISTWL